MSDREDQVVTLLALTRRPLTRPEILRTLRGLGNPIAEQACTRALDAALDSGRIQKIGVRFIIHSGY